MVKKASFLIITPNYYLYTYTFNYKKRNMKTVQNYLRNAAKLAHDRLLVAFNLKNINFNFYFFKRWSFTTPYLSIGYDKQPLFADWRVDIDFSFFFWVIQIDFDNSYKYYPKYENKDSN